ncbi:unnamed protein product [Dovyalis caffra]|uniref:Uncharacterized protein n=1 Tax=Dovyalis caffra TaxID=77055 RepID=A0AAV1QZ61_9ROSI|nr:unnamed protein product [Dovyalis caffra]
MQSYGAEDWENLSSIYSLYSDDGFYQDDKSQQEGFGPSQNQLQTSLDYGLFDDHRFDILSPLPQMFLEKTAKPGEIQNGIQYGVEHVATYLTSLKLPRNYRNRFKRSSSDKTIQPSKDTPFTKVKSQGLSTEEIMRIAGANFIQSSTKMADVSYMLKNPFNLSLSGFSSEETKKVKLSESLLASAEQSMLFKPTTLACHHDAPFTQLIAQLSGIQAIIENVADAKRIHVIYLPIRNGVQWTVLMQALLSQSECLLELLKITAVGTTSKHSMEETENLFELDADETVAVYCEYLLRTLLPLPDGLEAIYDKSDQKAQSMYNGAHAYFDSLDACMEPVDQNRMIIESMHFAEGIRNTVATEREERKIRIAKVEVRRGFFSRFGLEETELSTSSLSQAYLVVKKFACWSSCTLDMDDIALFSYGYCLLLKRTLPLA